MKSIGLLVAICTLMLLFISASAEKPVGANIASRQIRGIIERQANGTNDTAKNMITLSQVEKEGIVSCQGKGDKVIVWCQADSSFSGKVYVKEDDIKHEGLSDATGPPKTGGGSNETSSGGTTASAASPRRFRRQGTVAPASDGSDGAGGGGSGWYKVEYMPKRGGDPFTSNCIAEDENGAEVGSLAVNVKASVITNMTVFVKRDQDPEVELKDGAKHEVDLSKKNKVTCAVKDSFPTPSITLKCGKLEAKGEDEASVNIDRNTKFSEECTCEESNDACTKGQTLKFNLKIKGGKGSDGHRIVVNLPEIVVGILAGLFLTYFQAK